MEYEVSGNLCLKVKSLLRTKRGIGYFVAHNAFNRVISIKREEFLTAELPNLFKSMKLLDIELEQIITQYQQGDKHENQ